MNELFSYFHLLQLHRTSSVNIEKNMFHFSLEGKTNVNYRSPIEFQELEQLQRPPFFSEGHFTM